MLRRASNGETLCVVQGMAGTMRNFRVSSGALLLVATVACGATAPPAAGSDSNAEGGAGKAGNAPAMAGTSSGGGGASAPASGGAALTSGGAAVSAAGSSGASGAAVGGGGGAYSGSGGVAGVASGGVAAWSSSGDGAGGNTTPPLVGECFKQEKPAPFFDAARGDCGPSPPADLALRNGPGAGTDGGVAGAGNTAATGGGPAILWCNSPTDIWATDVVSAGGADSPSNHLQHWNGTDWTTVTSGDDSYFESGWGHAADDVWFVGHGGHVSFNHVLFVMHWNGTHLEYLNLPATIQAWQQGVVGTPDGDVWIAANGSTFHVPRPLPPDCLTAVTF